MKSLKRFSAWTVAAVAALLVAGPLHAQNDTLRVGIVKEIRAGTGGSSPEQGVVMGDYLYFSAYDPDNGDRELYRTDGTAEGTERVVDINPTGSSDPSELTVYNGSIWFNATDGVNGRELWRSDGTESGTMMVKDINVVGESNPTTFEILGNDLYFTALDTSHGREWWMTSGGEPTLVKDLSTGNGYGVAESPDYTVWGSELYFRSQDLTSIGEELHILGGGDIRALDLEDGYQSSGPSWFATTANGVHFIASNDTTDGAEIWYTNGTMDNTYTVTDAYGTPDHLHAIANDQVVFFLDNGGSVGEELYLLDEEQLNGFTLIKDINPGGSDSYAEEFFLAAGRLFFIADDGTHGEELWVTGGSGQTTHIVEDVDDTESSFFNPAPLGTLGSSLVFVGDDDVHGPEFWIAHEHYTAAFMVRDLNPGDPGGAEEYMGVEWNGRFFVAGGTDATGTELAVIEWEQPPERPVLIAPAADAMVTSGDGFEVAFSWHEADDPNAGQAVNEYIFSAAATPPGGSETVVEAVGLTDTTHTVHLPDSLGLASFSGTVEVDWHVRAVSGTDTASSDTVHLTLDASASSAPEAGAALPERFALGEAHPNPFNPRVNVALNVPRAAQVRAVVYNVLGRKVATLADGRLRAGTHHLTWRPGNLTSGIYFLRVTAGEQFRQVRRLVFMK